MTKSTQLYSNNASTTLATTVGQTDTTIIVASATGFPTPIAGGTQYFKATIDSGTNIEIIYVYGVSGSSFTGCLRGQEGTTAQSFQAGTVIENRVTAGTLDQYARYQDILATGQTIATLNPPSLSDGNSYICTTTDESGNPIIAFVDGSIWRFSTHPVVQSSGTTTVAGGTTSTTITGIQSALGTFSLGEYLIQFVSGSNIGYTRVITSASGSTLSWSTAFPNAIAVGDQYQIYQSTSSALNNLTQSNNNGLIYSIIFSD